MRINKFLVRILKIIISFINKILEHPKSIIIGLLNGGERKEPWIIGLKSDPIFQFPSNKDNQITREKIVIEREYRNVLLTNVSSTFKYAVNVSKGDLLDFGIGVKRDPQLNPRYGYSFNVYIQDNNNKELLFHKSLYPDFLPEDRSWLDVKIDLSEYSGNDKEIIFQSKSIGPINLFQENKVAWSNPIVYREYKRNINDNINVILISLDACRPDHLGCYGYHKDTSSNIDSFAKDCILFKNAISQSHWTLPTHMSMFTSLYPSTHKIYINRRLDPSITTLPQELRNNGYNCYGFVSHLRLSPNYGYARGFDYYNYKEYDLWTKRATAEDITLKTMKFLTENRYKKNFIFLHYFDIHSPYIPPNNYSIKFNMKYRGKITGRERDLDLFEKPLNNIFTDPRNKISKDDLDHIISLYDGEIFNLDQYIGMLINHLKSLDIYENSLIILTADHGEELWEHKNMGHNTIYDETLKVPMLIKLPFNMKQKNLRINKLIQGSIDIFPTIMDILKLPIPQGLQGNSILPLITKMNQSEKKHLNVAFSERLSNWNLKEYGITIRTLKYKYIYTTHFDITNFSNFQKCDEIKELYNLTTDPKESKNIIEEKKEIADSFQEKIDKFIKNTLEHHKIGSKEKLNQKIKELKTLGRI